MKKIIAKLFGVYAGVKNINGRKSSGVEDSGGFKHWAYYNPNGYDNVNWFIKKQKEASASFFCYDKKDNSYL